MADERAVHLYAFDTGLLAVCRILFCRVFNSHSQYPY